MPRKMSEEEYLGHREYILKLVSENQVERAILFLRGLTEDIFDEESENWAAIISMKLADTQEHFTKGILSFSERQKCREEVCGICFNILKGMRHSSSIGGLTIMLQTGVAKLQSITLESGLDAPAQEEIEEKLNKLRNLRIWSIISYAPYAIAVSYISYQIYRLNRVIKRCQSFEINYSENPDDEQ